MALSKVNYVDNQTIITAQNLNDIQDEIIQNAELIKKAAPRNLLDNSDFTNPVNQRGLVAYTGSAYTIDRWRFWADEASLTVGDGYIQKNNNRLFQYLESGRIDQNKVYTAALCVDGTTQVYSGSFADGFGSWNDGVWCYFDDETPTFRIEGNIEGEITWTALYEGEYTTETLPTYVPKGYAVELAECQRYYRREKTVCTIGSQYTTGSVFSVVFPKMRINATVNLISASSQGWSNVNVADYSLGWGDADEDSSTQYRNYLREDSSDDCGKTIIVHYEASAEL